MNEHLSETIEIIAPMSQAEKRQADVATREIVLSPEMLAAGVELMAAWDDEDAHHRAEWGGCYGAFVERLVRDVLARHCPAVSVRMPLND